MIRVPGVVTMTENDLSVFDFDGDEDADDRGPALIRAALKKRKSSDDLWTPSSERIRTQRKKSGVGGRTRSRTPRKGENAGDPKNIKGVLPIQTHRNTSPIIIDDEDGRLSKERMKELREEKTDYRRLLQQVLDMSRLWYFQVTITTEDVETLRPMAFLNDTIVDFYIKYLQETEVSEDQKQRAHFFNSFFFTKLAEADDLDGDEAQAAFSRLEKWTKNLSFFDKDFIFLPVNQSLHWSLLIICHGDGVTSILHLDSLGSYHASIETCIRKYIIQMLKKSGRIQNEEDIQAIEFIRTEVPQQGNAHDCGLFLLHYVELLLERIFSFPRGHKLPFIRIDWFEPSEASAKRKNILEALHQLYTSRWGAPSSSQDEGKSIWVDEEDVVCV